MTTTGPIVSAYLKTGFVCPLLLLGFASAPSIVMAQSEGVFTATGSMITARSDHTATLLSDGSVMIAGGFVDGSNFSPTSSAEIYDPSTGTFRATGSMTTARYGHMATLLPEGRVLIAGGVDTSDRISAELYDPTTGTFAATGNLRGVTRVQTATLLSTGKVLITGSNRTSPSLAELYDPSTQTFTLTGEPVWAYDSPTATLLPTGSVLLAEGRSHVYSADRTYNYGGAELYDSTTGMFGPVGDMTPLFEGRTTTLLANGKLLVAGGFCMDCGNFSGSEVYDPEIGRSTVAGNMSAARQQHRATMLPDGRVLISGGVCTGWAQYCLPSPEASADLYDPSTASFTATGNMTTARNLHTATLLSDGAVLISGGYRDSTVHASAEIYHPTALVPAPVLLSLSGDGQGQGAVQHAGTYRIASVDDPAVAGEYLSIYLTGLTDGGLIPPQVSIGSHLAEVTFFGIVPGYPGLNVVNVRMPGGVAPGPAVPVLLTYLGRPSNRVAIGAL